ncbi:MAG: DUF3040 domain-containing protein [Actinobacteria bacterium]|nr:DUF3040 domain-containing protein [Actinomycetota bacterium]
MPLSEDEQRILREIEAKFYESDPELAREVATTTVYRHALRSIRWAVLGLVVCLAGMVVALSVHVALAFAGFLGMLACALVIERNARTMGRTGWQELSGGNGGMRGVFGIVVQRRGEPGPSDS